MKVIEFIKDQGVERAREVVKGAPEGATHYGLRQYRQWEGRTLKTFTDESWRATAVFGGNLRFIEDDCLCIQDLKRLVESVDLISRVGIKRAIKAIAENTLRASYYQPSSGSYFRYGHNSLYVVRDGGWKEIYGGMDSNTLIHTDRLKQAIADYESIYGASHE